MLAALVALPGLVGLSALPASAQVTYAPEAFATPPVLVVRRSPSRAVEETVLVPHTRYVRRSVLVPRTHYVRRRLVVPVTSYVVATGLPAIRVGPYAPAPGYVIPYAGTGWIGPTWVPPGTTYACQLGTIGCDSSVVGAVPY